MSLIKGCVKYCAMILCFWGEKIMKDIPMFTTQNGVASLTLKEIPLRLTAYIKILSSEEPIKLLEECVAFCRMCGAEYIYASGSDCLLENPLSATLVQMIASDLPETDACLFPVTESTVSLWREIYNDRMKLVPNASSMNLADEKKILQDGKCYFIHKNSELLGIGMVSDDSIEAVASVKKGAGEDCVLALASLLNVDRVKLVVAEQNKAAISLYKRMGFIAVKEIARWYKII